jgi:iron-regulated transporter 1
MRAADDAAGDPADGEGRPLLLPLDVERSPGRPLAVARASADAPLPLQPPRSAARTLYCAHALSAWGARMWCGGGGEVGGRGCGQPSTRRPSRPASLPPPPPREFTAGLALFDLGARDTFTLVAVLGLAQAAAQAAAGPAVGRWADGAPRLPAARTLVSVQALATLASAGAVLVARATGVGAAGAVAAVFAAVAAVGAQGNTLTVEREWTAVLACGDPSTLAQLNAGMRRVDLVCLILAPAAAGALMSLPGAGGPFAAVAAVAAYSAAAWPAQMWLLGRAALRAPALGEPRARPPCGAHPPARLSALAAYAAADAAPAGVALALLYCTVLSFGPLATAFLWARGVGELELAAWRGAGALAGLAATALYPPLHTRLGLDRAGGVGLGLQTAALAGGCVAAFGLAPSSAVGARCLAAALAASRMGLWLFDLAAAQALQERVPREALGAVNGVQASLQAAAGALSYAAALMAPSPASFGGLAAGSLAAVAGAGCVFLFGGLRARKRGAAAAAGL